MIVHKGWEIPHVWPDAAPIHAVRDTYEGKGLKQSSVLMGIEPNMDVLPIWKEKDLPIWRFSGFWDSGSISTGPHEWTEWALCGFQMIFHMRAKTRYSFARRSQTHQYDHIQEWLCLSENRLPRFDMFH